MLPLLTIIRFAAACEDRRANMTSVHATVLMSWCLQDCRKDELDSLIKEEFVARSVPVKTSQLQYYVIEWNLRTAIKLACGRLLHLSQHFCRARRVILILLVVENPLAPRSIKQKYTPRSNNRPAQSIR